MFPKEARQGILDVAMRNSSPAMGLVKALPAGTDDNMTLAAIVAQECDYPGYARTAVPDPGASSINGSNEATDTTVTMTFQPVGMVTPQTIYGYFLTWVPPTLAVRLFCWVRLTTPVVLVDDTSQFQRVLTFDVQTYNP